MWGGGVVGHRFWLGVLAFVSVVTIMSLPPALLLMVGLAQVEFGTGGLVVVLKNTGGLSALLSAIVLGSLLLISAWMLRRVQRAPVRRGVTVREVLPGALVGLGLWVVIWLVISLLPHLNLAGPVHGFVQGLGSGRTPSDSVFYALAMIIIMPVCEEVYFRGSLHPVLGHVLGSSKGAVLLGSLAFAALHAQGELFVAYAIIGVFLVFLSSKYGMLAATCAHSVFNALCFLSLLKK